MNYKYFLAVTNTVLLALSCTFCTLLPKVQKRFAFVATPIIDLVPNQILTNQPNIQAQCGYELLPLETKGVTTCKRIHQLLCNEIVQVLEETKTELKILVLNSFYSDRYGIKHGTYWVDKKNFVFLDTLKNNAHTCIPAPILYKTQPIPNIIPKSNHKPQTPKPEPTRRGDEGMREQEDEESRDRVVQRSSKGILGQINTFDGTIVTLTQPFFETTSGKTYSVGTRFVLAKQHSCKKNRNSLLKKNGLSKKNIIPTKKQSKTVAVQLFDRTICGCKTIEIPTALCMYNTPKTDDQKRALFVKLVKSWANQTSGFIPYVQGGCSFTRTCNANKVAIVQSIDTNDNNKIIYAYTRPDFAQNPLAGFDCSGLVLRAAQIADIPYFYKNTVTLKAHLAPIKQFKDLQNGDLIFYKGHVVIVSDISKNKIIETKTVRHGYGKVHEISLDKAFEGVCTYKDLFALQKSKKSIKRKGADGKTVQIIHEIYFLKLL